MELTQNQVNSLKDLMRSSAKKGNLANAAIVLEKGKVIVSTESLVNSEDDATAHAELSGVRKACEIKKSMTTPGLTLVTIVEPCLMCLSACAWAEYKKVAFIIPAEKYEAKIPWMTEVENLDKVGLISKFKDTFELVHLKKYQKEFCEIFEQVMSNFLR